MTWSMETSCGDEAAKIAYRIVPYTRGRGLDVGCGRFKAFPHFIGVDSGKDYGGRAVADIQSDGGDLSLFADASLDFVFSSHFLEHVEDTEATLREWWRVIRPGGHLALYLPHKAHYPNIGEPGANPDHKHDFMPEDITAIMRGLPDAATGGWDLVEDEERAERDEYSFFQVYRKRADGLVTEQPWRKPENALLLVRYGAIGDHMITASSIAALKAQGWRITLNTCPTGYEIQKHNPHIDAFIVQDKDQVPNEWLGNYWTAWAREFDHFINLSESVEVSLLANPGRTNHFWPAAARRKILGAVNYMEREHDICGVPYDFAPGFHATKAERDQARERAQMYGKGRKLVAVALSGSGVHKTYPHIWRVVEHLLDRGDVAVVLMGDARCRVLEEFCLEMILRRRAPMTAEELQAAQEEHADRDAYRAWLEKSVADLFGGKRLYLKAGAWGIRESLAFVQRASVVIGPETGLLNCVSTIPTIGKVVFLSHSSPTNLVKHWKNAIALSADQEAVPCHPCHMLHHGWAYCRRDEETGAAACAAALSHKDVIACVERFIPQKEAVA